MIAARRTPRVPDQNLINQTRVSPAEPAGFWRSVALDVLSLFSALGTGYAYSCYLAAGFSPWWVIAGLLVFSAASVLQVLLMTKTGRRALVILGEAAMLLVWFIFTDGWQIAAGTGVIVFLLLLWGYLSARSHLRNGIEISFLGTSRRVIGKLATAAVVFMILVYAPQAAAGGAALAPRASFGTFFDWSAGVVGAFYPNIPFTGSLGAFSEGIAKTELRQNPSFTLLDPNSQNAAVAAAAAQITANVGAATGVAAAPGDSLGDVAYRAVANLLAGVRQKFPRAFVFAWAVVLFFILRSVGIVFVWVAQFVALVAYEILLAAGFMKITQETQTKELISF